MTAKKLHLSQKAWARISKYFAHKSEIIFSSITVNVCLWCSKEPSRRDGSFEHPHYMFKVINKKINLELPVRFRKAEVDTGLSIKNKQRNSETISWKSFGLSITHVNKRISRILFIVCMSVTF